VTAPTVETGTILDEILRRTTLDLAERKRRVPVAELERRAAGRAAAVPFGGALRGSGVAVITEVKRASPSRGRFPVEVDPPAVAAAYFEGGAAAISVLTDGPFFQGSLADLEAVAEVAHGRLRPAPVLRKDFVVDPYQVVEARASGADAVLLIVAALEDSVLRGLLAEIAAHGMEALVEVHDEDELERALAAGAATIGINNRDLRSCAVDLAVSERLAPMVPAGTTVVAESGVFSADDVRRLGRAGTHAVLVGESLILVADRGAAVRALRGDG